MTFLRGISNLNLYFPILGGSTPKAFLGDQHVFLMMLDYACLSGSHL